MANAPSTASELATRPAHVPEALVTDFDFRMPKRGTGDIHLGWRDLQNGPDIVWTPHNGGHWIVTRAEDLKTMFTETEHLSSKASSIPRFEPAMKPINLDPPDQGPYRRLIMPSFLPKEIDRLGGDARAIAREIIASLKPQGHCEFVADFASELPIVVFMRLMGLPLDDRFRIKPYAEAAVRGTKAEHDEAHRQMAGYFAGRLAEKNYSPDGLAAKIVAAEIDGAPMPHDDVMKVCLLLLFGGLDTVASMLGFVAHFLARHPAHRHELRDRIDDAAFVRNAVEELIRRHGVPNVTRLVKKDWTYKGVDFREGDLIQLPALMGGLDDRFVDDPLRVDFSRRFPIPHTAFGFGAHTCPGAVLARREIQVFLEEWLPQIPDFDVVGEVETAGGLVNGVLRLDLKWDPSAA